MPVRKGSKSVGRNEKGEALFDETQVKPIRPSSDEGWDYEYSMEEALGSWDWYK
jgi:hypothetical protein